MPETSVETLILECSNYWACRASPYRNQTLWWSPKHGTLALAQGGIRGDKVPAHPAHGRVDEHRKTYPFEFNCEKKIDRMEVKATVENFRYLVVVTDDILQEVRQVLMLSDVRLA